MSYKERDSPVPGHKLLIPPKCGRGGIYPFTMLLGINFSSRPKCGRGGIYPFTMLLGINFSSRPKCGRGGIRTRGAIAGSHAFQACAFDRSATLPKDLDKTNNKNIFQILNKSIALIGICKHIFKAVEALQCNVSIFAMIFHIPKSNLARLR